MPSKANAPLLDSQKNEVFKLIANFGFDPGEFEWTIVRSPYAPPHTIDQLVHRSSGYYCGFDVNPGAVGLQGDRLTLMSPGRETVNVSVFSYGWDGQRDSVGQWLEGLRREVGVVSLWDTFGRETTRAIIDADLSNRSLSRDEKAQIAAQVAQVRTFVAGYVSDPKQLKRIEKKIDELNDATNRLGAKDYTMFALGTLMSIAVAAAFDPERAQQLVNLFFHGVRALIGQ